MLFSQPGFSQFLPVIANQSRATYEIRTDGTRLLIKQESGAFYRANDGSKLTRWRVVNNGVEQGEGIGVLTSGQTGLVHRIDYDAKQVKQTQQLQTPLQPSHRDLSKSTGQQVINGILCRSFPMKVNGTANGGTVWVSPENDLIVKVEWTVRTATKVMQGVEELSDIQIGVQPDSRAFEVPPGFFITGPPPAVPACTSCVRH